MPHEVESMFSGQNIRPWHGHGQILPGLLTSREALVASGLDWQVELIPVFGQSSKFGILETAHQAVVRQTDSKVLGIVGSSYRELQNVDAFSVIDPLIADGSAVWETAGSLYGGKVTFMLAKLPEDIIIRRNGLDDPIKNYLLVSNSHDGTKAVLAKLTPVRVVCANTLSIAVKGGGFKISHVGDMKNRVQTACDALGLASKMACEAQKSYQAMADREISYDQAMAYFKKCLKVETVVGTDNQVSDLLESDIISQIAETEVEKISKRLNNVLDLYETGKGADQARGSVWGAYNAVIELSDHATGYRTDDARQSASLTGGYGNIKGLALKHALALV